MKPASRIAATLAAGWIVATGIGPIARRSWAQDGPRWFARVEVSGTTVRVNDQAILTIRKANGGFKAGERARIAGERIRDAIRDGLEADELRVAVDHEMRSRKVRRTVTRKVPKTVRRKVGKGKNAKVKKVVVQVSRRVRTMVTVRYEVEVEARVLGRGRILAVARGADADAAGVDEPSDLAGAWRRELASALRLPGLSVSSDRQVIPLGERRTIRIGGVARGPIAVRVEGGKASPIGAVLRGGMLTLSGKDLGRDSLVLEREGATARIDIKVQHLAADFLPAAPVSLTGAGIRADALATLVARRAREAVVARPGGQVRLDPEPEAVPSPPPGKARGVPVWVSVEGPDLIPVRRVVVVPLRPGPLRREETKALFFSNDPERFSDFGTLYVGRLDRSPARLLWHHQNGMQSPVWFVVELINDTDAPMRIQAVGADAGPVRDTVWVGYRAASDFLTDFKGDSGVVLDIAPRSRMAVRATRLPSGLSLSGLMQFRVVEGGAPLIRVAADRLGDTLSVPGILANHPVHEALVQEATRLSEHVYTTPQKTLKVHYRVGGRYGMVFLGRAPVERPGGVLDGCYGVFYDIDVELENPTSAPADVRFVLEPAAGLTGGVFLIGNKRVEIPQINLPREKVLERVRLAPGGKRTVRMRTIPLSGSNYPVNIWIRSGR